MNIDQFIRATGATVARATVAFPFAEFAMRTYGIHDGKEAADFLAQVGHETLSLIYKNELWGSAPTSDQATYERDFSQPWQALLNGKRFRNSKAFELGNVNKGDGFKFRGHGWIQVTGRANHVGARDRMRARIGAIVPDFEKNPELLELPEWAALSAADFWDYKKLGPLALSDDFVTMTKRINGGTNGMPDRRARQRLARLTFGVGE